MRLLPLLAALALLATPVLLPAPAAAQPVEIDIDQAQVQPLPIALPALGGGGSIGAEMVTVISNDLERSGFFRPVPNAGGVEPDLTVAVQPRFEAWRTTGAAALLNGAVTVDPDGRLRVDVRLWDVPNQSQLLGTQFTSTRENWRRVAHKVADAVYEKLTGEKGYFDTRVVFVAESGPKVRRVKRLTIMDQDGANPSFLTDGSYLVLTPRFSTTDQEVTYMALRPQGSSLYVLNIETGRQETLGQFQGMVSAPRFSPDGRRVAFSLERNGNSDLWSMDLRTRQQTRLTADPAIDTSPSYSPDGDRLVFNSDRGGQPQLYVMAANGGGARRISFGAGRYTTPVWSPKGDWIAFTKQSGSRFSIGVMRPDGSDERLLTSSDLDEGPTWAPNGRVLMFTRETGGGPKLWTVDLTGQVERAAAYPGQASDPAWSPLLN